MLLAREALASGRSFTFTARGASMRPYLRDGDVVTLAPLRRRPRLGEVVLLDVGPLGLVHRVVGLAPGGRVCVKGDALPVIDGWFDVSAILASAVEVRRGGRPVRVGGLDAVTISVVGGLARRVRHRG